jgi:hypothetical protein
MRLCGRRLLRAVACKTAQAAAAGDAEALEKGVARAVMIAPEE